jgi:hypothetical protein
MFAPGKSRSILLDALLGAASGLVASWAMEVAQSRVIARAGTEQTRERERMAQAGTEPATTRAAEVAARLVRRSLDERQKRIGGEIVHYATGAAWGAIFGALAPRIPAPLVAAGAVYGLVVWIVNDELLVPVLGWAKGPTAYPPSVHAKALASHVVFGTTAGASYRLLASILH